MATITQGDVGQGLMLPGCPIYEGTATRTDVYGPSGLIEGGVTYAAGVDNDDIKNGWQFLKTYGSFAEDGFQIVAAGGNGSDIVGRLISITNNTPTISANAGTASATLTNCRRGTVEQFVVGQIISVKVDGSGTAVAIGDKLSLKTALTDTFVQDNSNGTFYALKTASADGDIIPVRVI